MPIFVKLALKLEKWTLLENYSTINDTPNVDDVKIKMFICRWLSIFFTVERRLENINIRTIWWQMRISVKSKQNENKDF